MEEGCIRMGVTMRAVSRAPAQWGCDASSKLGPRGAGMRATASIVSNASKYVVSTKAITKGCDASSKQGPRAVGM